MRAIATAPARDPPYFQSEMVRRKLTRQLPLGRLEANPAEVPEPFGGASGGGLSRTTIGPPAVSLLLRPQIRRESRNVHFGCSGHGYSCAIDSDNLPVVCWGALVRQ